MKKSIVISIIFMFIIGMLGGAVSASSVSVSTSAKTVKIGEQVKVTVSFGEKVSAIQFNLNYDTSKFVYITNSLEDSDGMYKAGGKFAFIKTKPSASSVQFTFEAKSEGKVNFLVSDMSYKVEPKSNSVSVSEMKSVSVTSEKKKETPVNNTTTPKNNTTNTTKNTVKNTIVSNTNTNSTSNIVDENTAMVNEVEQNSIDENQIEDTTTVAEPTENKNSIWNIIMYIVIALLVIAIIITIVAIIRKKITNEK